MILLPSIYPHQFHHHHGQHRDVPTSCMTFSFYACNVYLLNRCCFNFVAPLSLQVLKQKVLVELLPHHAFSCCRALKIPISCHNGFYHCNRVDRGYFLLVLLNYIRTSQNIAAARKARLQYVITREHKPSFGSTPYSLDCSRQHLEYMVACHQ